MPTLKSDQWLLRKVQLSCILNSSSMELAFVPYILFSVFPPQWLYTRGKNNLAFVPYILFSLFFPHNDCKCVGKKMSEDTWGNHSEYLLRMTDARYNVHKRYYGKNSHCCHLMSNIFLLVVPTRCDPPLNFFFPYILNLMWAHITLFESLLSGGWR